MHRTQGANHSSNTFTDGVAGVSPGTQIEKNWLNDMQENACVACENAGVPLVKGTFTQLDTAIKQRSLALAVANWTDRVTAGPTTQGLQGVASDGAGTQVLVGNAGVIQSSADDGATWTSRTPGSAYAGNFAGVAYGGGKFVALGTGTIQTSPDGITWTQQSAGGAGTAFGLNYANGLWIATWSSGLIWTSPDGITWTPRTGVNATASCAGYGTSLYLTAGTAVIQTSPDGITWTARTIGSNGGAYAGTFWGLAYGNGIHVVVGNTGEVQTSPDGITWTRRSSGTTDDLKAVVYAAGYFVATPANNTYLLVSMDGVNWQKVRIPNVSKASEAICWSGWSWTIVGATGRVATSLKTAY
jgi:hypothetical protein